MLQQQILTFVTIQLQQMQEVWTCWIYQEVERRKGSTSTSEINVCLLNSHYLTCMNSLCVVSYVADEDAYTGGENVVEVQEESFGEH